MGRTEVSGHAGEPQPGVRTAPLQAHNAAWHQGRFCALLSPGNEASAGLVALRRWTLARPRPARGTARLRSSRPPILVCAAQGRPRPSLPSGVALQDRPAARFQPEPSHRSRGKMMIETLIERYRSTRMQTRQDCPWKVVTSPRIAKRFFLHHGRQ